MVLVACGVPFDYPLLNDWLIANAGNGAILHTFKRIKDDRGWERE